MKLPEESPHSSQRTLSGLMTRTQTTFPNCESVSKSNSSLLFDSKHSSKAAQIMTPTAISFTRTRCPNIEAQPKSETIDREI